MEQTEGPVGSSGAWPVAARAMGLGGLRSTALGVQAWALELGALGAGSPTCSGAGRGAEDHAGHPADPVPVAERSEWCPCPAEPASRPQVGSGGAWPRMGGGREGGARGGRGAEADAA